MVFGLYLGLWIRTLMVQLKSIIFCSLRLIEVFNLKTCPHKGRYKVPLCPVVLLQQHTGECFWEWWLSVKIAKIGVVEERGKTAAGSGSLFEGSAQFTPLSPCPPGFHLLV